MSFWDRVLIILSFYHFLLFGNDLTNSTDINITKFWPQEESGWTYPVFIKVPISAPPSDGFPVCILLHGNGGDGVGILNDWDSYLVNHILIAPTGYLNSWNIVNESSDAPDIEMINELISTIQNYDNVNINKIRILGSSNGSALANRIFIEITNPGVDAIFTIGSQLNDIMYQNGDFYYPSGVTGNNQNNGGYDIATIPLSGRYYLNVHNINDNVIPYYGGTVSFLGVGFHPALDAICYIANSQGYMGESINENSGTEINNSSVYEYSYLDGQVVHLSGNAGHGINNTQRNYIIEYINNIVTQLSVKNSNLANKFFLEKPYPNPFNPTLNIDYYIPQTSNVTIDIYDINGKKVEKIFQGKNNKGKYSIHWDSNNIPSGVYFIKLKSTNFSDKKKVVLVK